MIDKKPETTDRLFMGIDLSAESQAVQGKTCVVIAKELERGICVISIHYPLDDRELLAFLIAPSIVVCAIDAPLCLPPCVSCQTLACDCSLNKWSQMMGFSDQTLYHYRFSDLILRKTVRGISPKPALSDGGPIDITPLTLRWLRIMRLLQSQQISHNRFLEVYASGAIQLFALHFKLLKSGVFRYRASIENRTQLLCLLTESGQISCCEEHWHQITHSEDAFDATFACLSAWSAYHNLNLSLAQMLGLQTPNPTWLTPINAVSTSIRLQMLTYLQNNIHAVLPDPTKICKC